MINLKKLDIETAQLMRKWRNKNKHYFRDQNLITHKQQEKWFKKYEVDMEYWYFIVEVNTKLIGVLGFSIVDGGEAHIESVILGEDQYAKKGHMSEALQKMMAVFPFQKYTLKVIKNNKKAIKFYEKNGFGIAEETEDCYIMSRLLFE